MKSRLLTILTLIFLFTTCMKSRAQEFIIGFSGGMAYSNFDWTIGSNKKLGFSVGIEGEQEFNDIFTLSVENSILFTPGGVLNGRMYDPTNEVYLPAQDFKIGWIGGDLDFLGNISAGPLQFGGGLGINSVIPTGNFKEENSFGFTTGPFFGTSYDPTLYQSDVVIGSDVAGAQAGIFFEGVASLTYEYEDIRLRLQYHHMLGDYFKNNESMSQLNYTGGWNYFQLKFVYFFLVAGSK